MIQCKVCNKEIALIKENTYIAQDKVSFAAVLNGGATRYNAVDCPHCGCQNILNEIKPRADVSANVRPERKTAQNGNSHYVRYVNTDGTLGSLSA